MSADMSVGGRASVCVAASDVKTHRASACVAASEVGTIGGLFASRTHDSIASPGGNRFAEGPAAGLRLMKKFTSKLDVQGTGTRASDEFLQIPPPVATSDTKYDTHWVCKNCRT
jgi:hypothetical protein